MKRKNSKPTTRTIYISAPKNAKWDTRKKKISKPPQKLVVLEETKHNGSGDICTTCGGPHWSPDCPVTAKMVHDPVFRAQNAIQQALDYVRKLGFSPQLEVGIPSSGRQAITVRDIYLRPLDGSDKLCCSCCGNPYEAKKQQFRGTLPTPLNWCFSCREQLRERQRSIGDVLALHVDDRKGKLKLIRASEVRVRAWVKENQKRKNVLSSVK